MNEYNIESNFEKPNKSEELCEYENEEDSEE
jgi:hypothetical protein